MRKPLLVGCLALAVCCLSSAQSDRQTPLPPGSVDGAINPELIPDEVAFRLFLTSLASTSTPTPAPIAEQKAKLRPIGLSKADTAAVIQALSAFRNSLAEALSYSAKITLDDAARATMSELQAQMSPDGYQRLHDHVVAEKRHIKRVPFPPMTSHGGAGHGE